MTLFDALLMGMVEGFTEFLPISSTGHLILLAHLLTIPETEFLKSFEIAIQAGAIAAVALTVGKKLLGNPELAKRVLTAFIPTGIIGFLLYTVIKQYLIGNEHVVVGALAIGGVFMIIFELAFKKRIVTADTGKMVSYPQALVIGTAQALAMIPGTSRSAMTILSGCALGISRHTIVEFSFLLAIPTMLAATGYDILKHREFLSGEYAGMLLVGCIASFLAALVAIRLFLRYIKTHTFIPFGIYRIGIAIFFLLFIL